MIYGVSLVASERQAFMAGEDHRGAFGVKHDAFGDMEGIYIGGF